MHIRCPPHSERLGDNDYMMLDEGMVLAGAAFLASGGVVPPYPHSNLVHRSSLMFADAGCSPWLSSLPSLNRDAPIHSFPSHAGESLSPNLSIKPVIEEDIRHSSFPPAASGGKVSPPFNGAYPSSNVVHSPLLQEDLVTGQLDAPKRLEEPSALDRQRTYQRQKVEASLRNKPNLPIHIQEKVMAMVMKRGGRKTPSEVTILDRSTTDIEGGATDTSRLRPSEQNEVGGGDETSSMTNQVPGDHVPGIWNGTEVSSKSSNVTTMRLDESSCAMRKRANFEQMDHTMTALSRWNRNTALFRAQKVLMPKDFEPSTFSVLLGHRKEFRLSPGNIHLRSLCETYKARYDTSDREGKSDIVSTILTSIYQQCPVGAFLRFKDGRYYEVEDLLARDKIASDLRSMLPGKYRSTQKRRSQATRSTNNTPVVGGAAGEDHRANSASPQSNSSVIE